MTKINRLDKTIYNRISAGEVVEKPASVVKELVENSIDAGATEIFIEIIGGGIEKIAVTDNGSGISKDYVSAAFLPHATSKIEKLDDLDEISTLGFRGEALASISSVSKITMTTKAAEDDDATEIFLSGGQVEYVKPAARARGTTMIVENLFYNTPARAKFLKSARAEKSAVTETVKNFVLANPYIRIEYASDGAAVIKTDGRSERDGLAACYGKEVLNEMLRVIFIKDGIKVRGYTGNRYTSKPTKAYQTAIVNGRVVKNEIISTAVAKAYGNMMMTRSFPVYSLNIIMPFDEIDVNVHPAKTEVRFRDKNAVFSAVFRAVSDALEKNITVKTFEEPQHSVTENTQTESAEAGLIEKMKSATVQENGNLQSFFSANTLRETANYGSNFKRPAAVFPAPTGKPGQSTGQQVLDIKESHKIIGQVFSSFILVEQGESLFIIDQHAAQERMNFDKLKKQLEEKSVSSQALLVPYVLEVTSGEADFIESISPDLLSLGFEIAEFGELKFKLSAIPAVLSFMDPEKFIKTVLAEKNRFSGITASELFHERLAEIACKASIKAGDTLSEREVEKFISDFDTNPLQCPHGRPAIIKVTRKDFDKLFKRVL